MLCSVRQWAAGEWHKSPVCSLPPSQRKAQRDAQLSKLERAETALSKQIDTTMARLKELGTQLGLPETYLDPLKVRMVDVVVSLPLSESAAPLVALYR